MCGIAGQYRLDRPAELGEIRGMCDQIRHRGPDDDGYHLDGPCGLGVRRLSIIDLTTGHQPMANEDGSVSVVFNGEIYNFRELRQELEERGHRFKTKSDTEVLVHLYEQEGVSGIEKLRGMFAYAVWDANAGSLLLVRDRFGKKPLYYAVFDRGLFFASELKCLRAAGAPLELDQEAFRYYFQLSYIPDPWSPFRAIRKLEPGCWLRFLPNGRLERGRYWKLPVPADRPAPGMVEEDVRAELKRLFDEAVRVRLISDVPLGAFLSGGIDSSSIVASMALQTEQPVKTFSAGFDDAESNELPYARAVAEKYRTEHHELVVHPDSVALVSELVRCFDEPFGDSAAIPTYLVSEFAAQHVKVVLTGDGGDELFAGYDEFGQLDRWRFLDYVPQPVRSAISLLADALPYSAYGKNFLRTVSRSTALERYFDLHSVPYYLRKQLLKPESMAPADATFLKTTFGEFLAGDGANALTQALYFEATAQLSGDMLVKVDRMSMIHSLEVRCPLLDQRLAELSAKIPHGWKIRNGRGKDIFIRAVGHRLPPSLLNRPKMGFDVPLALWFRTSLRSFVRDSLLGSDFARRGMASPEFVRYLLDEHASGRRDNHRYLWIMLMAELWFREFVRGESSKNPG
jgi:asparagine synthase (glutamine-hydrolysing)